MPHHGVWQRRCTLLRALSLAQSSSPCDIPTEAPGLNCRPASVPVFKHRLFSDTALHAALAVGAAVSMLEAPATSLLAMRSRVYAGRVLACLRQVGCTHAYKGDSRIARIWPYTLTPPFDP
jgi:hypothetical protein